MNQSHTAICPFLNLKDDRTLRFRFAHPKNYCYKPEAPLPIGLKHQDIFCLKHKYKECPVFLSEIIGDVPEEILVKNLQKKFALPLKEILSTIVLIIGINILVILNLMLQQNFGSDSQEIKRTTTTNENITTTYSINPDEKLKDNIAQQSEGILPFSMPSFIENREKFRNEKINNTRVPIKGISLQKPNRDFMSGDSLNSIIETYRNILNMDFFEVGYLDF